MRDLLDKVFYLKVCVAQCIAAKDTQADWERHRHGFGTLFDLTSRAEK